MAGHKRVQIDVFLRITSAVALMAGLQAGCSDTTDKAGGKGTVVTDAPQIEVTPENVVFSSAIVGGESNFEQITVSNTGLGDLIVSHILLDETDDVKEFRLSFEVPRDSEGRKTVNIDEKDVCPNTRNFRLVGVGKEGQSYCVFWVEYLPQDAQADIGTVTIKSNDTRIPTFTVGLSTGESAPELTVTPAPPIRFQDVLEGQTPEKRVTIFNSGNSDLQIDQITLVNDADGQFQVEIAQDEGTYHTLPAVIAPSPDIENRETLVLIVTYTPNRAGRAEGKIRIESNDPNHGSMDVVIEAKSIKPCIEVVPHDADFGDVAINDVKELALDITNCGTAEITVTEISLVEGTSPDFQIQTVPSGIECNDQGQCTGELHIAEEHTETVVITYTPGEEGPDGGHLLIRNDVPGKEDLEVQLFGRGTTNTCPVAVAEARIQGSDTWDEYPSAERELETIPLKTLELRGDRSTDPDGSIASYGWTVLSRPEGSTAQLSPHEADPNPTFFLDLAGEYVFELQVVDDKGLPSCQNALVVVKAIPDEDIHVQLVWDTPGDPDQTDEGFGAGSDLDLHLLHPLGDWFDTPYDCFYGNPNPDWGRPSNPSDDPSLDIDDTDGAGPENINLDNPQPNTVYRVGVHYFNDHSYGASFATVRIYIQGIMRFELANKRMPATDYFWDVATISWPGGNIQQIDNLLSSAPNGGGQH